MDWEEFRNEVDGKVCASSFCCWDDVRSSRAFGHCADDLLSGKGRPARVDNFKAEVPCGDMNMLLFREDVDIVRVDHGYAVLGDYGIKLFICMMDDYDRWHESCYLV